MPTFSNTLVATDMDISIKLQYAALTDWSLQPGTFQNLFYMWLWFLFPKERMNEIYQGIELLLPCWWPHCKCKGTNGGAPVRIALHVFLPPAQCDGENMVKVQPLLWCSFGKKKALHWTVITMSGTCLWHHMQITGMCKSIKRCY